VGAIRSIYGLWSILSNTSKWVDNLKSNFASQIATNIRSVRDWNHTYGVDEITKAANALKMVESVFRFISENRDFLAKGTTLFAAGITICFYCYFSFLFSSVYWGLAKLQNIHWHWSAALIDSLYMPFAFSNLPNNVPIQLLAGLQAIAVGIMGYNIFFRHLSGRFERIAVAASELRIPINDVELKGKLIIIEQFISAQQISRPGDAKGTEPVTTDVEDSTIHDDATELDALNPS
jgi:hypothetical protein